MANFGQIWPTWTKIGQILADFGGRRAKLTPDHALGTSFRVDLEEVRVQSSSLNNSSPLAAPSPGACSARSHVNCGRASVHRVSQRRPFATLEGPFGPTFGRPPPNLGLACTSAEEFCMGCRLVGERPCRRPEVRLPGDSLEHSRPGLGFGRYSGFPAPMLAVEPMSEVPPRSTGSGVELQKRFRGYNRRRQTGFSSRSELRAPIFRRIAMSARAQFQRL